MKDSLAYTHAKATLNVHVKRCKLCREGVPSTNADGHMIFTFCPRGEALSAIADEAAEALNRLETGAL
jgi:hypothetical protein